MNWQPSCQWHHDAIKQRLELAYRAGKLSVEALSLSSAEAIALTKRHMRVQIGLDGWPIEDNETTGGPENVAGRR